MSYAILSFFIYLEYVNRISCYLLRFSQQILVGQSVYEFIHLFGFSHFTSMVSVFNTFEKKHSFYSLLCVCAHFSMWVCACKCRCHEGRRDHSGVRVKGGYDPPNMVNKLRLSKRTISCSKR